MVKWQRALYQPGVPLGENGTRVTASKEHREMSKEAAKEGMVLLKNEHCLARQRLTMSKVAAEAEM